MRSDKVRPHHRDRKAILYVRQSSTTTSCTTARAGRSEYAMRDRLRALGWYEIEFIDDDLGRSGSWQRRARRLRAHGGRFSLARSGPSRPGKSRGSPAKSRSQHLAGFRSEPSSVKSLERSSRRRFHASVRGRHPGRHIMPSEGSRRANLRERGSSPTAGPPACYRLHRLPRPGDGTSAGQDESELPPNCVPALLDHAAAASLPKRNTLPSTHKRCRTIASFLASATFARLMPRRLATSRAQRLRVEKLPLRVSITCAAS